MTLPKSLTTVTTFSKILALFLFLLLPFAGFYVGYNYNQSSLVSTPIVQQIKTPTSTPDSTASWKTYSDKKLGFTFMYPDYNEEIHHNGPVPYCSKNQNETPLGFVGLGLYKPEDLQKRSASYKPYPIIYVTIAIYNNIKELDPEEWYTKNCFDQKGIKSIATVDDAKGLKISGGLGMGGTDTRIFILSKYKKIYFFSSDSSPKLFEQILSTFKFIQ